MKTNENIINNLHKVSITLLIALNVFTNNLQSLLYKNDTVAYLKILSSFLINAGLYTLIFFICKGIYYIFWKLKYPECNISGIWYHYHFMEKDKTYLRVGTVNIKQSFFSIKMTGENHSVESFDNVTPKLQNDKMTYWYSTMGKIKPNGEIKTCYVSERTSGDSDIREGIHNYIVLSNSIFKKKPTKIIGKFKDCSPCKKHGCIVLYRDEKTRNIDAQNLYIKRKKTN